MKTDMVALTGDRLNVTGTAEGSYTVKVIDGGAGAARQSDRLTLVDMAGSTATFELSGGYANIGAWRHEMEQVRSSGTSSQWQLYSTKAASDPGSAAVNNFAGSYLMAYAETQTLIQRLGDLRNTPYLNGLWFRLHGGKFESNAKSYVRGFDMDYGGVQIGYDRKLEAWAEGELYLGAMFGYSKGDLDYPGSGKGEVDSKTLGIYGAYVRPGGFYLDAVLKYQWMENDFEVMDSSVGTVRGDGVNTGGFGWSVGVGQRLRFNSRSKEGWYAEPQLQFSYQRQDGGTFRASNGTVIGVEAFNSLLGRVGIALGYETERSNFYAKVSKVKEFDGDLNIVSGNNSISESFGSSWWTYGIGVTSRINERNSFYFDVERSSGGTFRQPWKVNGGWRVSF